MAYKGLTNKEYTKQYREKNKEKLKEDWKQYIMQNKEKRDTYLKNYNEKNKEKIALRHKRYREKNKEKLKYYYKNYHTKNKERETEYYIQNKYRIQKQRKKHREENKEYVKEQDKKNYHKYKDKIKNRREQNRDEILKKNRICYLRNIDKNRKRNNTYKKKRVSEDLGFKLAGYLRSRIYIAIKNNSGEKAYKTIELLGCTIEYLKNYLESQFDDTMSWYNYGFWHLDHIRPCASFDLTNPEEQKKCFHYTNLQPLWAEDNIRKGKQVYI